MPDPYWEKIGKEIKERQLRGDSEDPGKWAGAAVPCKKCKKPFYTERRRVLCDDCKPEVEGNHEGPRTVHRRLREAEDLEAGDTE